LKALFAVLKTLSYNLKTATGPAGFFFSSAKLKRFSISQKESLTINSFSTDCKANIVKIGAIFDHYTMIINIVI